MNHRAITIKYFKLISLIITILNIYNIGFAYQQNNRQDLIDKALNIVELKEKSNKKLPTSKNTSKSYAKHSPLIDLRDKRIKIESNLKELNKENTAKNKTDIDSFQDQGISTLFYRENPLTQLSFAIERSKITYSEPGLMREKGYMTGFSGYFIYRTKRNEIFKNLSEIIDPQNINMFKLSAKVSSGKADYDSNGTGSANNLDNILFEINGLAGIDISLSENLTLTPYLGLGYRYLYNDTRGTTSTGHLGYRRESNYYYVPIGLQTNNQLTKSLTCQVNLEYDYFIYGNQLSHLEDVDSGYDAIANDQTSGSGINGSVKIIKNYSSFDLFIEPFAKYWHILDSNIRPIVYAETIAGYGVEPENITREYGIKLGFNY